MCPDSNTAGLSTRELHFSIGPVQDFVAQARRTRDFWAGSFLLSWLSAVAMRSVTAHGGTILFPAANEHFLSWLEGRGSGKRPRQGNVPNRFKAGIPADFDPTVVTKSVHLAWNRLAGEIWQRDLAASCEPKQKEIWDRQIENFWEMQWAVTEDPGATDILDRRKFWRSHVPPPEPGIKCMVVEGLQELSGEPSPKTRHEKEAFWEGVRKNLAGWKQDLSDNEHLCAIAFLKRRFTHHFRQLEVAMPGGWTLHGWELNPAVPSGAFLAATHWLASLIQSEDESILRELASASRDLSDSSRLHAEDVACIQAALDAREWEGDAPSFSSEGSPFFRTALENPRLFDLKNTDRMEKALSAVSLDTSPSPFYAVLAMDGDSLGKHMATVGNQQPLTAALQQFTQQVPVIVHRHNGFLLYAGGDDVLALFPLEDALPCATELHRVYGESFEGSSIHSTLSGAVLFVHVKQPLGGVLRTAHSLLAEVAKEKTGRDSLAVRVDKPGGTVVRWAMPWKCALESTEAGERLVLDALAEEFAALDSEGPELSNRFFFKIRERYELLNPPEEGSAVPPILNHDDALALLTADLLSSGKNTGLNLTAETAQERIAPLLGQSRPVVRATLPDGTERPLEDWPSRGRLDVDAALLIRFLAQKGQRA